MARLLPQLVLFILTRIVLHTGYRMVYPFLPVFARGLGVDLTQMSLAITIRSASGVFAPFLAATADSRGRRNGMLLGLLLFSAGMTVVAIWPSFPGFIGTLVLTLIGNLVFIPSIQAYIGDRVPYERRGLAVSLPELSWSISSLVTVPAAGLLIANLGWRAIFPVLAGLGVLAFAGVAVLVQRDLIQPGSQLGMPRNLRSIFTSPPALAGLATGLLYSAANELVTLVFGVWMEDSFGLQVAALGAASAVIGFSELGGEALAGGLSDRLGKHRALAAGLLLNCLAAFSLPWLGLTLNGALAGLFLFFITFEYTVVSSISLMTEIMPSARATYMAVFIAILSVGRMLGDLVSPHLYRLGATLPGLPTLAPVVVGTVVFNLLSLYALSHVPRHSQTPPHPA